MNDNVVKFPANRIVRQVPGPPEPVGNRLVAERAAVTNAKNVYDNLVFELLETYKIKQTKALKMDLPLLEDLIKIIFKRDITAEEPSDTGPPPLVA